MANIVTYNHHEYVMRLRTRISKMTSWKDVLKVIYSNVRTVVNSYMSTEPDFVGGTRGTAYAYTDFALTADTLTISTYKNLPMFIDEADRYQQSYVSWMELADYQGEKALEYLETQTLAQHSNWTDFGAADLAGSGTDDTTAISVSSSNIDDIIRAVKRKINTNNGTKLAVQKGYFFVWRPEDFEALEAFVQANGYNLADLALKNGIPYQMAFHYMGVDHYLSTCHTANHVFAGVKKCGEIGILTGTWGQAKTIEDPNLQSGLGIVSRIDYGFNWPAQLAEFSIDVNVS